MLMLPIYLLSFLLCHDATAGELLSGEQQALLKVERHLADLELLIEAAEQSADPDARVQFRYDWLRRDVDKIRNGVQAHVQRPQAEKLVNAAIGGDYQR